ncbi:hypothetical protein MTR_2g439250 [Medicago truncatula]|uniref:Uncharacterized protein n=1 Tax=Medicago truncatula TaxID=3880 RepID=A2Q560_MEDTR|nr:hypothetical protein MtrDRAFT_AC160012g16v2 [Medicago truncatula]KEH37477.1 hypothetical protein MTR_2g439250 [Medicago truncatula]
MSQFTTIGAAKESKTKIWINGWEDWEVGEAEEIKKVEMEHENKQKVNTMEV